MVVKLEQLKYVNYDNEWLTLEEVEYIKKCYKKDNRIFLVLGIILLVLSTAIAVIFASGVAGNITQEEMIAVAVLLAFCIIMGIVCIIAGNRRQKKIENCLDNHNYNIKNTGLTRVFDTRVGYVNTYSCECYGIPGTWGIFDRKRAKKAHPGHYVKFVVMWGVNRLQAVFVLLNQ